MADDLSKGEVESGVAEVVDKDGGESGEGSVRQELKAGALQSQGEEDKESSHIRLFGSYPKEDAVNRKTTRRGGSGGGVGNPLTGEGYSPRKEDDLGFRRRPNSARVPPGGRSDGLW